MKKIISLVALLLCASMLFAGCGNKQDPSVPDGFQLISSEEADYNLYVPTEWIPGINNLSTSAYFSRGADATSISVTAFGADLAGQTVEKWWDEYKKDFEAEFDNFEVISEEDASLGGVDGKKYTFTATKGVETDAEGKETATQYNFICVAVVKDTYVYFLLYTSTPKYYEEHLSTLGDVISHFSFK